MPDDKSLAERELAFVREQTQTELGNIRKLSRRIRRELDLAENDIQTAFTLLNALTGRARILIEDAQKVEARLTGLEAIITGRPPKGGDSGGSTNG
jgi:hypothetical protein